MQGLPMPPLAQQKLKASPKRSGVHLGGGGGAASAGAPQARQARVRVRRHRGQPHPRLPWNGPHTR